MQDVHIENPSYTPSLSRRNAMPQEVPLKVTLTSTINIQALNEVATIKMKIPE